MAEQETFTDLSRALRKNGYAAELPDKQKTSSTTFAEMWEEMWKEGYEAGLAAGKTVADPSTAARNPEAYGYDDPTRVHHEYWLDAFIAGWHAGLPQ